MKPILLLVLIVGVKGVTITPGLTTTAGTKRIKDVIGPIEQSNNEDRRNKVAKFAKKYGVELKVNQDAVTNEANFIRPCGCDFINLKCVRKFLQDNSKCKPAYGPIKEPFYLAQHTQNFPFLNLTVTSSNFTCTGLNNYEIIEFYYNKVTCKLVIAFEIKNLNETSPLVYFSYHRTAKESLVLADYANVFTKSLIITVIIPDVPDLHLELGQVHSYTPDTTAIIKIGPKAYTSNDPDVREVYASILKSPSIVSRERTLFKADLLAALIIQKTICDFGVKLYKL